MTGMHTLYFLTNCPFVIVLGYKCTVVAQFDVVKYLRAMM